MEPLLSVLIVACDMERYLDACMTSVLAQTYPRFEVVLVDDGSTDATAALADGYAQRDGRVRVIHQPGAGVSAARNACLDAARGDYLTFVDADDWVAPDYLERLLGLCRSENVLLAACNHWIVAMSGRSTTRFPRTGGARTLTRREACENVLYHGIPDVCTWGKLYHRSVLEGVRYPDGKLYEDAFRIADVLMRVDKLAFLTEPLYSYRIRSDSISRGAYSPRKLELLEAVDSLCDTIAAAYPDLKDGCVRRRAHAALSVRRYLVDCAAKDKSVRDRLEAAVLQDAEALLRDPKAPRRDKLAIRALRLGSGAYDLFWKAYSRVKG